MENLNTEDDGPGFTERWFGEGPGRWWGLVAVAAAVGIRALWQNRELRQQNSQLQVERKKNRFRLTDKDGVQSCTLVNSFFVRDPFEKKTPENGELRVVEKLHYEPKMGRAIRQLNDLEELLLERQHIYCSYFRPRSQRIQLEEQMEQLWVNDEMRNQFKKVLESDRSCGSCLGFLWSGDKKKNGGAMWTLLREWRSITLKETEKNGQSITFSRPCEEEKSEK